MQYLAWSLFDCDDIGVIEKYSGLQFLLDFVMGPKFPEKERNSHWHHLNQLYQKHINYKKSIIKYGKEVVSVPDAVMDYIVFYILVNTLFIRSLRQQISLHM